MKKNNLSSSIGDINGNVVILIAYIGGYILSMVPYISYFCWVLPFILYLMERKNKLVREHSIQAVCLYIFSILISLMIQFIAVLIVFGGLQNLQNGWGVAVSGIFILRFISQAISVAILIFVIIACAKGWHYEFYSIPIIGKISQKLGNFIDRMTNRKLKEETPNEKEEKE